MKKKKHKPTHKTPMDRFDLWLRTLGDAGDHLDPQRELLRQALLSFRDRTTFLIGHIGAQLPELTVHDISHIDALWRVADEIAGPEYPINPAEAFVLGGAFFLHDAAHVTMAYEDGVTGLKRTIEWKDLIAQRFGNAEPQAGSKEERAALFQILRHLHAKQARKLATLSWKAPEQSDPIHLLEHTQLRMYFGDLIGEIAESHHWPAQLVARTFESRNVGAPGFLAPADWKVDPLKVALLLRTADAAHIDSERAPWFLFALRQPSGISREHWKFQTKLGQPARNENGELQISSGSPFSLADRQAWWLAYDAACLIDRELRDARSILRDSGREPFAAVAAAHTDTPEAFSRNVVCTGWEPLNVAPKISNIPGVIAKLGGAKLYGDKPELALRELIQNGADAILALRALQSAGMSEGEVEVALEPQHDMAWLHVSDTGIGMSRYVLTQVLLDFGNSLWGSEDLRTELPGLASSGFNAVGRFGIGFFSVFMLGKKVLVTTRRYSKQTDDQSDQWILEFEDGLDGRPSLRRPVAGEGLNRCGTRISVLLDAATAVRVSEASFSSSWLSRSNAEELNNGSPEEKAKAIKKIKAESLKNVLANLCPSIDVRVTARLGSNKPAVTIKPGDWKALAAERLLLRAQSGFGDPHTQGLLDLRESDGTLVGRVGHTSEYRHAIVTHGGLRSGRVPGLVGLLLGDNNADLARTKSMPKASKDAWRSWARAWIDNFGDASLQATVDLHPLTPDSDLPVYRIGTQRFTELQLKEILSQQSSIDVLERFPEHEDYDDISKDRFSEGVHLNDDLLVLPHSNCELANHIGIPKVDYDDRLIKLLLAVWPDFDREEVEVCVGSVSDFDLYRQVQRYERVPSE